MIKKVLFILFFSIIIVSIGGCANAEYETPGTGDDNQSDVPNQEIEDNVPNRKIIYRVSSRLDTENLDCTISKIRDNLESDEWFDRETITDNEATFVIRIKSSRLDSFISFLYENGKVNNLNKYATDVSLDYQDHTNRISSLNIERIRLVELYDEASIPDMIEINKRVSEIDEEIAYLQGTLNEYDSLIDYSEVTLTIYEVSTTDNLSFSQRLGSGFLNGLKALLSFFETVTVVFVTIFPFLVSFSIIGLGIYFIIKFNKKRRETKKNKSH